MNDEVTLATFGVFDSHTGVAAVLVNTDENIEHHCRKFYGTMVGRWVSG
jgi:hypothetical protein